MLDLDNPPRLFEGVILFPDHAAPNRWYVAGSRVRPKRPGSLRLDVFRGGFDGGFLEIELTTDPLPAALAAAEDSLGPDAVVVPVDWVAGRVWLAGRLAEQDVAKNVGSPGTAGSTDTLIALRVGEDVARVLQAALRGDAVPAVIGVELEGEGLAAPLEAEIEADMAAVYDAFAAQGALITPVGRARAALLIEDLARSGAIQVHVVDGAGDEVRSSALQRFGEDLLRRAFQPIPMTALAPRLDPAMANIELQFKLSWRRDSGEQHLRWSYKERTARRFSHFLSASVLGWAGTESVVHEHDTEPDAGTLAVVAVGRFAEVGVELGPPASVAVRLTPEAPRAEVLLASAARAALQYRVTTTFPEGTLVEPGPRQGEWIPAPHALSLVVDPAVVHGVWAASFELLAAGTGCDRVELRVFREELETRLALDPGSPHARLAFTTPGWRLERTWIYGQESLVDEVDVAPGSNVLRPPTRLVETRVLVVADEGLEAIDLTLVAVGPPAWRIALSLAPDAPGRSVPLVLPAGAPESWTWTATVIYADGRTRVDTGGPTRVLILGAPEGVRKVAAALLLPPEAQGLGAVTLTLTAGDAHAFAWLDGPTTDAVLLLPAAAPAGWSLVVEGIRLDGSRVSQTLSGDGDVAVVPPFSP